MATEKGKVVRIGIDTAWVKTVKSSACKSCASRDTCTEGGGAKEMEVEAINTIGAGIGDEVVIKVETSSFLKATFLLYVFPILCMLIGAVIGQTYGSSLIGLKGNDASVAFGLAFFFVSVAIVKTCGNRLGRRKDYRPRIIKVYRHG